MTPYQKHRERWKRCNNCLLCEQRNKVILARGTIPAQVLFIGEAPGVSEDVLGRPFVGPAGKLLDRIIREGLPATCSYALTNLVACIPKGEGGEKIGEPPEEAIKACSYRLQEFVSLCKPKLVVSVGALAAKWVGKLLLLEQGVGQAHPHRIKLAVGKSPADHLLLRLDIIHPAAILRMDVSQRGLAVQRCTVALMDAVDEIA